MMLGMTTILCHQTIHATMRRLITMLQNSCVIMLLCLSSDDDCSAMLPCQLTKQQLNYYTVHNARHRFTQQFNNFQHKTFAVC